MTITRSMKTAVYDSTGTQFLKSIVMAKFLAMQLLGKQAASQSTTLIFNMGVLMSARRVRLSRFVISVRDWIIVLVLQDLRQRELERFITETAFSLVSPLF